MQQTTRHVDYVTKEHSGLTRAYYKTVDWGMPVPSISDIMNNPDYYIVLMYHISMNHKGLNWRIYRTQLNSDTYPVFMYSLAFCAMNENPCFSCSWQMNKNARRIRKFIKENAVSIDSYETKLLGICSNFPNWNEYKANRISEISSMIEHFHELYEI